MSEGDGQSSDSFRIPGFLTAVSSVPGGVSLFGLAIERTVLSTFFDPRMPQPTWGSWFAIHPEQKFQVLGRIAPVSSVAGGISLFGVDADGVVMSTFFDPRLPNPEWGPWFAIHPEQTFAPLNAG